MTTTNEKVKIIGLGGAGANFIKYLKSQDIKDIEVIMANTDKESLKKMKEKFEVPVIQLGEDPDLEQGAKGDPEKGFMAANNSYDQFKKALKGSDLIFIRAGMGGGTGSSASVVAAEIARKIGAITIALMNMPFYFEGPKRKNVAEEWFEKLKQKVDGVAVLPNDILLQNQRGDKSFQAVLEEGDSYFKDIVKVVSCTLKQQKELLLNLLKHEDLCFIGAGHDWGIDGLKNAVINAIKFLTDFNNVEIKNLTHIIILISTKEIEDEENTEFINDLFKTTNMDVIWSKDNELDENEVRCVIIGK